MSQIEYAMERMYGEPGLTDELTDDEAKVLLSWGEAMVFKLGEHNYDEETFDAKFTQLRRTMKRLNRLIGRRENEDPTGTEETLAKIAASMGELGYEVPVETLNKLVSTIRAVSKVEALEMVLNLFGGKGPATEADDTPPPPEDDPTGSELPPALPPSTDPTL